MCTYSLSHSIDISAVFMKDTPNAIKNKINKHAFSGGQETLEEHRAKGGDTTKDVPGGPFLAKSVSLMYPCSTGHRPR